MVKKRKKKKYNLKTDYNFSESEISDLKKKKHFKKTVHFTSDKTDVRKTKEWLEFKIFMKYKQNNLDPISEQPLTTTANLHHLDYHAENYGNFDSDNFVLLNQLDHKIIHGLAVIAKKIGTKKLLENLEKILDRTLELNEDISRFPLAH